jgi:hypothetical protein
MAGQCATCHPERTLHRRIISERLTGYFEGVAQAVASDPLRSGQPLEPSCRGGDPRQASVG